MWHHFTCLIGSVQYTTVTLKSLFVFVLFTGIRGRQRWALIILFPFKEYSVFFNLISNISRTCSVRASLESDGLGDSNTYCRSVMSSSWLCLCQVSFTLNEELTMIDSMGEKASMVRAPREHPFTLQTVGGQTLAVFTETSSGKEFTSCVMRVKLQLKGPRSQT